MLKLFSKAYGEELEGDKKNPPSFLQHVLFLSVTVCLGVTAKTDSTKYEHHKCGFQAERVIYVNHLTCFSQARNFLWTKLKMSSLFKGMSAHMLEDIKDIAQRPPENTF